MQPPDMLLLVGGRLGALERPPANVALLRLVLLRGVRVQSRGRPAALVGRQPGRHRAGARVARQRVTARRHAQRPQIRRRGPPRRDRQLLRRYGDCHLS